MLHPLRITARCACKNARMPVGADPGKALSSARRSLTGVKAIQQRSRCSRGAVGARDHRHSSAARRARQPTTCASQRHGRKQQLRIEGIAQNAVAHRSVLQYLFSGRTVGAYRAWLRRPRGDKRRVDHVLHTAAPSSVDRVAVLRRAAGRCIRRVGAHKQHARRTLHGGVQRIGLVEVREAHPHTKSRQVFELVGLARGCNEGHVRPIPQKQRDHLARERAGSTAYKQRAASGAGVNGVHENCLSCPERSDRRSIGGGRLPQEQSGMQAHAACTRQADRPETVEAVNFEATRAHQGEGGFRNQRKTIRMSE